MTPILSSQSGMSLVEVLVALFILALASAAIVMTLPRQPSRLDREVARLELAIDRLADEAIASGEVRAAAIGAHIAIPSGDLCLNIAPGASGE